MTYTDEDILDLYNDLQTVGAAETREEEILRIKGYLSKVKTLQLASNLLTEKGIPHTFYSYTKFLSAEENFIRSTGRRTNWILVKGQAVYFDFGSGFTGVIPLGSELTPERNNERETFLSDSHHTDIRDLPKPGSKFPTKL
jgi:hypothetical protein